jgi:hypothetical protein
MIGLMGKFSRKEETDKDDDVIANSNIQEVSYAQDKLRNAQNKDELKKKKVYKAMRLLESSFNPEASTMLQNIEQGREILLEQANVVLLLRNCIVKEPSIFEEARNHEGLKARGKW